MTLHSDHPPIYAAPDKSGLSLAGHLMLATAIALWLVPMAMTLKGMVK